MCHQSNQLDGHGVRTRVPAVDINIEPASRDHGTNWNDMRSLLWRALDSFPEAREAVGREWEALFDGNQG